MQIPIRPAQIDGGGGPGVPGRRARRDEGLTRTQRREKDDRATVWAFVWILFTFKAATAVIIWVVASRSAEATSILAGTHWFWLILPMIAVAGPLVYQVRVRRVRRRVRALRRSEWLVSSRPGVTVDAEALRRAEWMVD